jgi:hypothetical protein
MCHHHLLHPVRRSVNAAAPVTVKNVCNRSIELKVDPELPAVGFTIVLTIYTNIKRYRKGQIQKITAIKQTSNASGSARQ